MVGTLCTHDHRTMRRCFKSKHRCVILTIQHFKKCIFIATFEQLHLRRMTCCTRISMVTAGEKKELRLWQRESILRTVMAKGGKYLMKKYQRNYTWKKYVFPKLTIFKNVCPFLVIYDNKVEINAHILKV